MIKAVVLDIDGVIVGTKKGINFPNPDPNVCKALRKVHDRGVPVVFITAKTSFAAFKNIKYVGVDNPHIADSGAVLFNPVRGDLLHVKALSSVDVSRIISVVPDSTLIHLFTTRDYFVIKKVQEKSPDFIKKYSDFMQRMPIALESFNKIIKDEKIAKINIYAFDSKEKNQITETISKSMNGVVYKWATNPHLAPVEIMVITASGVSKRSGVETLTQDYLKVSLDEVLGVGDMLQDWDFLEVCGYKATLANGSKELKSKLDFKNKKQFMGRHVDEDGILDILKHFKLI